MDHRVPPQNLEAEKSILGGLMLECEAWDEVSDIIRPDDFYSPANKKIYDVISYLASKGRPSDLITVSEILVTRNELDTVGGSSYLLELLDATPSAANILSYAQIVKEKSLLRHIIKISQGFIERAFSQNFEDVDKFIDDCESNIFSLAQKTAANGLVPTSQLVQTSLEKLQELFAMKGELTGLSSGFNELDNLSAGLQPSELIILAARPSMGKTALSLNILLHIALRTKKKVAYFSVEMSKESVMSRLLANEAHIALSNIRVGRLTNEDWSRLIPAASTIGDSAIFIDDSSDLSPLDVRAKSRRMKAKHGLDLIIIDYLQLMTMKTKVESREREVSEMSRTLKAVAKELDIPILALAQLNRGVEGRSDRRPMLSDLRESGSIEQDADMIMMLYREDYYDKTNTEAKGIAEIIIGKQRNGPTGTIKLHWEPEYGRFCNYIEEEMGPQPPLPEGPLPPIKNTPPQNMAPFIS